MLSEGEPQRMSLFALLYPSSTLAAVYSLVATMNAQMTSPNTFAVLMGVGKSDVAA